ncbi:hypothetical protein ACFO4L_15530 [Bacillus daqingensis]|uniref:Uncharacterized protein n=1 Tax=Bacillus daqingensis TaxID=872396 RepID=A0ABV9P2A0_9BACI
MDAAVLNRYSEPISGVHEGVRNQQHREQAARRLLKNHFSCLLSRLHDVVHHLAGFFGSVFRYYLDSPAFIEAAPESGAGLHLNSGFFCEACQTRSGSAHAFITFTVPKA